MKTDDRLIFPSGELATYENLLRLLSMVDSGSARLEELKNLPDKHLVLFDSGEGSVITAQAVADGEKATKPTVEGVTEWTKDGDEFDFDTPITENMVLVAVASDAPDASEVSA